MHERDELAGLAGLAGLGPTYRVSRWVIKYVRTSSKCWW